MKTHILKCQQPYFADVASGKKSFEIRYDDRWYEVGDILHLKEWDGDKFTGAEVTRIVSYVMRGGHFGVAADYVALALV